MILHPRSIDKRSISIAFAMVLCSLTGCAQYQSQPLTPESVEKNLTVPDNEDLKVAAAKINHPTLKPLTLDLHDGLSPDEAAILAVLINPDLVEQRDQRALSAAQVLQAGILPNPQFSGNLDIPYDADAADNFLAYAVGLNWDITSLIGRRTRIGAARAQAESVDLEIAWQEWQVAQTAKIAAFDVIALQSQLKETQIAADKLSENLTIVRKAVDQHEKTILDLAAAQTAQQDAQASVLNQQKDLNHQTLALNRALGLPAQWKLLVSSEPLPDALNPPSYEQAIDEVENRRLDLMALRKGYESEDATLRAAILRQFPAIGAGVNIARDTSNIHTRGISATADIPIFDRNQGAIATEKATRQKLFDEYVGRVYAARADIAASIDNIRSINRQIAAAQTSLPGLENLVRTYETAMQRGNLDVLSYYTAQSELSQKRVEVIKLKQQLIDEWINLETDAGQYLPRALSSTKPATEAGS
jgi:cobalt-zinc-cadmium efflux system outer membrane protein